MIVESTVCSTVLVKRLVTATVLVTGMTVARATFWRIVLVDRSVMVVVVVEGNTVVEVTVTVVEAPTVLVGVMVTMFVTAAARFLTEAVTTTEGIPRHEQAEAYLWVLAQAETAYVGTPTALLIETVAPTANVADATVLDGAAWPKRPRISATKDWKKDGS